MRNPSRRRQVEFALAQLVGFAVVAGLIIAGSVWALVSALNLRSTIPTATGSAAPISTPAPLPTVALTPKGLKTPPPGTRTNGSLADIAPTMSASPAGAISLSASPQTVPSYGLITLSGAWPGKGGTTLHVQTKDSSGAWSDFATVTASVQSSGSYTTYIRTSHTGVNHVRMYDPATKTASNVVQVTIQ